MDLSIVTTMYQSAPHLEEFYRRCCVAAEKITQHYEIILVNDGSPDSSLDIAVSLHEGDERVRVIDLSRNYGHHKAMMTGLAHARGKLVFLIDCDLEEDPELLEPFHEELLVSGADVTYGVQDSRGGRLFGRVAGQQQPADRHLPFLPVSGRLQGSPRNHSRLRSIAKAQRHTPSREGSGSL